MAFFSLQEGIRAHLQRHMCSQRVWFGYTHLITVGNRSRGYRVFYWRIDKPFLFPTFAGYNWRSSFVFNCEGYSFLSDFVRIIVFVRWRSNIDRQCTYNVILRLVRATIVAVEKRWVLHNMSVYVFVESGIQHAMRMRHIFVCGLIIFFCIIS